MRRLLHYVAAASFLMLSATTSVRAGMLYDLILTEDVGGIAIGSGQIELDALSGNSVADGVVDFSLASTPTFSEFSYGLLDLNKIVWSINSATLALSITEFDTRLTLGSDGLTSCSALGGVCDQTVLLPVPLPPFLVPADLYSFIKIDSGNLILVEIASLTATPVGQRIAPEPTTVVLFGLGLVGLGFIARRRGNVFRPNL